VVKVDPAKKTLTVQMADGTRKELTVGQNTKILGPRGGASEQGLKDDRLAPGAEVRVVLAPGGREAREVHLGYRRGGERAARGPRQPIVGRVVKVDAEGHTVTVAVHGANGKDEEQRTVEVGKNVKVTSQPTLKEIKMGELRTGQTVQLVERDGEVVEVRRLVGPGVGRPIRPARPDADK
jgi:hypothetical protein